MSIHNSWTKTKIIPLVSVQFIRRGLQNQTPVDNKYDVTFSLLEEGSQVKLQMLSQDAGGNSSNYAIQTTGTIYVIPNNLEEMRSDLQKIARYTPTEVILRGGAHENQSAGATIGFQFQTLTGQPNAATVAKYKVSWDVETVPYRFRLVVNFSMIHSIDLLDVTAWSRLFVQGVGWT